MTIEDGDVQRIRKIYFGAGITVFQSQHKYLVKGTLNYGTHATGI